MHLISSSQMEPLLVTIVELEHAMQGANHMQVGQALIQHVPMDFFAMMEMHGHKSTKHHLRGRMGRLGVLI